MSFWQSDLGELSGNAQDAFAKTFMHIPDNTMATAKIIKFSNESYQEVKHLKIDWLLTNGDFKGQHVFQKLHVFDVDPKKRHRALNMLMLLYKMFNMQPKADAPPSDIDLTFFEGREAGIKVQETVPNDEGKQYNWVSEVHPIAGFICETGKSVEVVHTRIESAFSRNQAVNNTGLLNDIPF